jgi:hypothetical protein
MMRSSRCRGKRSAIVDHFSATPAAGYRFPWLYAHNGSAKSNGAVRHVLLAEKHGSDGAARRTAVDQVARSPIAGVPISAFAVLLLQRG